LPAFFWVKKRAGRYFSGWVIKFLLKLMETQIESPPIFPFASSNATLSPCHKACHNHGGSESLFSDVQLHPGRLTAGSPTAITNLKKGSHDLKQTSRELCAKC